MTARLVYDAGFLVAAARSVRRAWSRHERALATGITPAVPAAVVAQVWRDGRTQVPLSRLLVGCEVVELDDRRARRVGELLARARSTDVVDACVAVLAAERDADIVTSDARDIRLLVRHAKARVRVHEV